MKTFKYRFLIIIIFLASLVCCENICAANCVDEGYNTILTFYTKYINLRLTNRMVLNKTFTESSVNDCENKKYKLLQDYCMPQLVERQKMEDKYGMGLDLITDENDVDSISQKTLSVTPHNGYYTVSFQVHKIAFRNSSPIVQRQFNVWVENEGKLISKIIGENMNGEDSYSSRELPPDTPISINRADLTTNCIWSFLSKDPYWQSVSLKFTSTTMIISRFSNEVQSLQYYLSKTEPKNFDKSLVGKSTEGCYIVLSDSNNSSFFYFTISEYISGIGNLTLYNDGIDILDGSWYMHFKRKNI